MNDSAVPASRPTAQPSGTNRRSCVSVVLSFRNEEEVVPELLRRLTAALTPLEVDYELIFVNDASTDQSLSLLTEAAQRDARVKVLTTSRRFGNTECTLAGMAYAQGDAIVYMDTDLQDPPEVIPQLIELYSLRDRRGQRHVDLFGSGASEWRDV